MWSSDHWIVELEGDRRMDQLESSQVLWYSKLLLEFMKCVKTRGICIKQEQTLFHGFRSRIFANLLIHSWKILYAFFPSTTNMPWDFGRTIWRCKLLVSEQEACNHSHWKVNEGHRIKHARWSYRWRREFYQFLTSKRDSSPTTVCFSALCDVHCSLLNWTGFRSYLICSANYK